MAVLGSNTFFPHCLLGAEAGMPFSQFFLKHGFAEEETTIWWYYLCVLLALAKGPEAAG